MTSRPTLYLGSHLLPGLAAGALFVVVAAVTLGAEFPAVQGFPEGANITASIGYAMFNIPVDRISGQTLVSAESFLVAFLIVAVLLDAALDGAVMLAKREDGSLGEMVADGGREVRTVLRGGRDGDDRVDDDRARTRDRDRDRPDGGDV